MNQRQMRYLITLALVATTVATRAADGQQQAVENAVPWASWIEPEFPFFSTVVDARSTEPETAMDNLTARALVFPLGPDCLLAYDVDLLRVAIVWTPNEVPFKNGGMAVNSYPYQGVKVKGGLDALPQPQGEIWFQNGIYSGVGLGPPQITDPRPSLPDHEQVTRGGLDPERARFLGIDLSRGLEIQYEMGGSVRVGERFRREQNRLIRQLRIDAHGEPVFIVLAKDANPSAFQCRGAGVIETVDGHVVCRIDRSTEQQLVSIVFSLAGGPAQGSSPRRSQRSPPAPVVKTLRRWSEVVRLPLPASQGDQVLNLEAIPLPLENPYQRGVRPASVDFFEDGRAALVTYDGDVWLCEGLSPGSKQAVWSRFTSGLHEPLGIGIRNEEIFVFDRNGLWRLRDRDNNGEADYHELFCSRIDQTAETREFASALEVEKEGSFLVCKPGQADTFSAILRISPDGKHASLIARGFRQPFLGYDPLTGQIAASDQQGHWVPSTPVAFIKPGGFYGFRSGTAEEDTPVAPPLTWIPHQVCGSAGSIVWVREAKMGPLNDVPILISYNPPRLFQIHTDVDEQATQGGVTPLDLPGIAGPLLEGAVNPADGLLYLVGFKIWGTSAEPAAFFGRLRANPAKTWTLPNRTRTARRGILLRFDQPLDPESVRQPQSFAVRRWNYKRTSDYGSANFRLDGETGTDTLPVASAKLSVDGRSVFLGIPDMREVMQMEISYELAMDKGRPFQQQTYLTAHRLRVMDLTQHGFSDNEVDLTSKPMPLETRPLVQPTIARGARFYTQVGCVGCHSIDGSLAGKNGPSWLGLYQSQRKLVKSGEVVVADEAYLRESILNPAAKIAEGAIHGEAGMPIYAGVLSQEQIDSLLLYMKALAGENGPVVLTSDDPSAVATVDHQWKVNDFQKSLSGPLRDRSFDQGKMVFLGAACFSCHQVGEGKGGQIGPDLAKLNEKMRGMELLNHILEPSQRIEDKFKSRRVITLQGKVHVGFVVAENDTELRVADDPLTQQRTTVISKDEIEEILLLDLSPMPRGALHVFDEQQVLDLLAYIESRADPDHRVFGSDP